MAGLVPAIHALAAHKNVDARVAQASLRSLRKLDCVPAHDGFREAYEALLFIEAGFISGPCA
jgi:hypothetical protein